MKKNGGKDSTFFTSVSSFRILSVVLSLMPKKTVWCGAVAGGPGATVWLCFSQLFELGEVSFSKRKGCVCTTPCSVPGVRGAPAVHIQVPSRPALGWAFAAVIAGGKHSCLVSPVLHFIFVCQFLRLKLFWLNLLHEFRVLGKF